MALTINIKNAVKFALVCVILIVILLVNTPTSKVLAVSSITLSNPNTTSITDPNNEVEMDVLINIDVTDGTKYFLRGVFFRENSSNYCGYTWNGSNWFSGPYSSNDGWKNFPSIQIASNTAQMKLKAKLNSDDSGCKETGTYNFKVQRFTESGSGNFDTQNQLTLNVSLPTQTPTPSPSSTPEPTQKPSSTPNPTTQKPTPTKTLTPTKPSPTKDAQKSLSIQATGFVLGEETTPTPMEEKKEQSGFPFAIIMIALGGLLLTGAAVYAGILKKRKQI